MPRECVAFSFAAAARLMAARPARSFAFGGDHLRGGVDHRRDAAHVAQGGGSRQASVLNGLLELAEFGATDHDWVLVHDAARPGITPELIRTLVATLKDDPVGGIVALPVADTLKRVPAGGDAIARTESRDALWQAQTPQMFRIGMLREAILRAQREGHDLTDEASAIEWAGHTPRVVQGSLRNFKVTYPEDFALAEAILARPANAS